MNKKFLAVAVAGALATPGVALAQASSVTISGRFLVGVENLSYSKSPATRLNTSQTRLVDNASNIVFKVNEDLGNGLSAIAQLDQRFQPDQAQTVQTSNPVGTGATWVGLKSTTLGTLTAGRVDLHYSFIAPVDDTWVAGGPLGTHSSSLLDFINQTPIANASRTQNVVKYNSPNFNGFAATVAWSANPVGNSELDMINTAGAAATAQALTPGPIPGTVTLGAAGATSPVIGTTASRTGQGWNLNPSYTSGPFNIGYSYWNAKPDAPAAATNDQRGDLVSGYYKFGNFKIGLGWNKSRLSNANTGIKTAERTAWTLPMSYTWGPHAVLGHYSRASNISSNVVGAVTTNTGAHMVTLVYVYNLSKRTSLAGTYSKLNNDANASYNFFGSSSIGSTDAVPVAGESPRTFQVSIRHLF